MSYNTKRNANHDFMLTRKAINYRGVKTRDVRQRRHRRHLAAETCAPLSQIASKQGDVWPAVPYPRYRRAAGQIRN